MIYFFLQKYNFNKIWNRYSENEKVEWIKWNSLRKAYKHVKVSSYIKSNKVNLKNREYYELFLSEFTCNNYRKLDNIPLKHSCCSINKLCLTLCDFMDHSTLGFPALQYIQEFAQMYVHWVSYVI